MAASLATATVRYSAANDRRIGSFARATVAFSEKDGGLAAGRSALAALIPLAFVRHLQNIGDNPYVEREQIALLDSIASALLGGKSDLGKFEARNAEVGGLSAMGIPALVSERLWRARTFRTYLRQNPSGDLWAQITVPRLREPEYYGFWFIVPLIDYAVRNESYDDTVVPAMIAVREVCAFLKLMGRGLADSSELAEDDFEPMLGAQAVVNQIVTADDPAAAAKELQRELADDFVDDSSQDAAPSSGPPPQLDEIKRGTVAPGGSSPFDRRAAAFEPAADKLNNEIENSPVGDHFALLLLSCVWGGYAALQMFCNSLEAEERGELEDPDKAFVEAVEEPEAGEAALRAAVWATTVRILANNWPGRLDEAFEGAQSVLPLEERDVRLVRELGELTTGTATRGQLFRFSHLSLEWIMRAALGEEPEAILPSVTLWTPCFIHGLKEASEHLADLEEANPDMVVPD